ncbi:LRR receptor-like serine/threonine-protein kinase GSO1 [Carya illinoinensis]|uniref:LRR receptor-like serine/threonine-protein kinase GSO1 n=1 Tax=Carya illinoinensis TaxID=32201 RepID=UPI001C719167|nr:LRR receptor-like serine/threonine-protein kinase GSO1 [Carya illinoinensis]
MSSLSIDAKILNITTDQSALLALKAHISYDPHHILTTNWSSSTLICNWVGVTCGSKHHRVTALDLSNNGLVGTIPPHIGNLSLLVSLRLRNNSFHGSMPNELSHLYRLELLHFGYNELSGEIPSWIGLLTKLQSLLLPSNNFEGTIPSSLFNSTSSLQQLVLEDNQLWAPYHPLSSRACSQLPSSLFKCKQLQYLNLLSSNFSGKLSPEIGNLTQLLVLYLASNNFEGAIPSEIGNLQNLEVFHLGINNFAGTIPLEIFNISTIQVFSILGNHLSAVLEYLHLGYSTPIVYCDLKLSNVLLDEDMVGHVADFGIAKLLSDGISLTQTMTMATIGYMALEYGFGGIVSTRGDVYNYRILLIETFTRKKPVDDMFTSEISLKCLVEESFSLSILEVIDANLLSNENDYAAMETCLSTTMGLALHYCADLPEQRINMKNVLARLNKIKLKYLHDHRGG